MQSLLFHLIIAQTCTSGSFSYDGASATGADLSINTWYLNTQEPSNCSGQLEAIKVQYYAITSGPPRTVQVAFWKPEIADCEYTKVS